MTRISSAFQYISVALALSGSAVALGNGLQTAKQASVPSSIQEAMLLLVDPSADALWDSVGTIVTARGIEEHRPRTDAEWNKLASQAQTLISGAKRLQTPNLPVAAAHAALADASTPGARTAAQIRADIDADPARFIAAAIELERVSNQALKAIQARDTDAIFTVGDVLDAACEKCHQAYWYPSTPSRSTSHK